MDKKQAMKDCKRFAYVYGINLSGSERTGIAVMHEDYATAFDKWSEVLDVFRTWRDGKSFRDACMNPVKFQESL